MASYKAAVGLIADRLVGWIWCMLLIFGFGSLPVGVIVVLSTTLLALTGTNTAFRSA